jgi:hypothetical protein
MRSTQITRQRKCPNTGQPWHNFPPPGYGGDRFDIGTLAIFTLTAAPQTPLVASTIPLAGISSRGQSLGYACNPTFSGVVQASFDASCRAHGRADTFPTLACTARGSWEDHTPGPASRRAPPFHNPSCLARIPIGACFSSSVVAARG